MGNIIEAQLKVAGIEQVAQKLRDLDKISSTLTGRSGTASTSGKAWLGAFAGMNETMRRLNPHIAEAFAKGSSEGITNGVKKAFSGRVPPIIADFNKARLQNILAGVISMPHNPYMAARAFLGGFGGGGGGIGLGAGGVSSFLPAAAALAAVQTSAKILRVAFDELKNAIHATAKLYTDAARVGKSPGKLGILQGAFEAIGLSGSQAEQIMLQGEFGRFNRGRGAPGRKTVDVAGEILASGRGILQQGEIQQIQNMSKYLNQFVQESQLAGKVFQETSKQLFETNFAWDGLKREWKTFWTLLASEMSVALKPILRGLGAGLHAVNLIIEHSPNFWLLKQFMPKGDDFQQQFGNGGLRSLNTSSMQRIGFGFGGHATEVNYARRTAEGIEKLVNVVTKPQKKSQTPFPGFSPYYNMP